MAARKSPFQSPHHAEKSRENGRKGGRPARRVVYERRVLKPGEKVELPQPDIILDDIIFFIRVKGTEEEIAAHFLISVETLNKKLKEHFDMGFLELKKLVQASGSLALKINQFNQSKKNFQMAKHLGEVWLGQKAPEKVDVTHHNSQVTLYIPDNGRERDKHVQN